MRSSFDLTPELRNTTDDNQVELRQGKVESWDPETGANTIRVGDTLLEDLPVAVSTEGFSISAGDVVLLMWSKSTWFVFGRVAVPGDPARDRIRLVIHSEDGIVVRGGGGVTVEDGGMVRVRHADGSTAVAMGTLDGVRVGLVAFADNSQDNATMLRVRQEANGDRTIQLGGELTTIGSTGRINLSAPTHTTNHGVFVAMPIVTGSPNVLKGSSGRLAEIGSSRRYKRDIADLHIDPDQVLALRPRTWRDRPEVEEDPGDPTRIPGFIAEEVEEAGLTEFVTYNADGQVESISYDRLVAALIPLLRQQRDQINQLVARVSALERTQ